jgi:hypothetical protein
MLTTLPGSGGAGGLLPDPGDPLPQVRFPSAISPPSQPALGEAESDLGERQLHPAPGQPHPPRGGRLGCSHRMTRPGHPGFPRAAWLGLPPLLPCGRGPPHPARAHTQGGQDTLLTRHLSETISSDCPGQVSAKDVQLVSEHCPALRVLHLFFLSFQVHWQLYCL